VVETFKGPGKRAETIPEAAMEPMICAIKIRPARVHVTAPMSAMPRVTAGLKRPVEGIIRRCCMHGGFQSLLTSADSEENPCVDGQAESESEGDIHERAGIRDLTKAVVFLGVALLCSSGGGVGDLSCAEGKEEEENCGKASSDEGTSMETAVPPTHMFQ
jgi:hypothetical protein